MKTIKAKNSKNKNEPSAGELANGIQQTLEGAAFSSGASALVVVLARWITERGERPVLNAQVYGGLLETIVDCMERAALEKGRLSDAAA